MKRTMILGAVFTGVIALTSGCSSNSSSSAPQQRDYREYAHIRAGQYGSGDALGRGIYASRGQSGMNARMNAGNTGMNARMNARKDTGMNAATHSGDDGELNGDVIVGTIPSRQAAPRRVSPSYIPPRQDVAGVPQE